MFLEEVPPDVLPPLLPGVCLVVWGWGRVTMACHGVGPGCTAIGADNVCGGMWTAWVGAAVMGSPSAGVIVASPWTLGRSWWRPVGSVQVVVGSVIEWRRMAWSPAVISSHRSVPLWTAHSRGRSRNPLRSGVVRCCGGSSIVAMGWVRGSVRGLFCVVGGDGAWGISSSSCCGAFASCSSALMVAKTSGGWGRREGGVLVRSR